MLIKNATTTIRGINDNRKVGTVKQSVNDMFMYTACIRINMAKLYWRIKKNEKWTWVAARVYSSNALTTIAYNWQEVLQTKEEE